MKDAELYDRDYVEWTARTAELLRAGRFDEADIDHIAEEIEDMGGSEKRAVDSFTTQLLVHLLEWQHQPSGRTTDWEVSIIKQRGALRKAFRRAPSLRRDFAESLEENYTDAVKIASLETGLPKAVFGRACPYAQEQLLDEEFLPS
jgi:hypothetical protein